MVHSVELSATTGLISSLRAAVRELAVMEVGVFLSLTLLLSDIVSDRVLSFRFPSYVAFYPLVAQFEFFFNTVTYLYRCMLFFC